MGHHYVPQFYLRGFEAQGGIWTYDKLGGPSFATQVKSIANETGMYSEELESFLANKVEGPAKPALSKIRAKEMLSPEERISLAKYIVILWKRVPRARERAIERMPEVADEVQANIRAELDSLVEQNPSYREKVSEWKVQVDQVIAQHRQNPPPEVWYHSIQSQSDPAVVDATLSMNWTFLCSDHHQFLTCDNPVFFFEHEGISKPTSELTLPLSTSVALWASRGGAPNGRFLTATPAAVKEINRRTAHNSTRFVYASRNESWIEPFVCRQQWRLSRLKLHGDA